MSSAPTRSFNKYLPSQKVGVYFLLKAVNSALAQNKCSKSVAVVPGFSARQPTQPEQAEGVGRIPLSALSMPSWFHS